MQLRVENSKSVLIIIWKFLFISNQEKFRLQISPNTVTTFPIVNTAFKTLLTTYASRFTDFNNDLPNSLTNFAGLLQSCLKSEETLEKFTLNLRLSVYLKSKLKFNSWGIYTLNSINEQHCAIRDLIAQNTIHFIVSRLNWSSVVGSFKGLQFEKFLA